ncbi:MAG: isochorismatase family protein [Candidatus Promineifilaceae bacterium]
MLPSYALIDPHDSLLIVIDVQTVFLDKLPQTDSDRLLNKICWLINVANWCEIPLVVTAEEHDQFPVAQQVSNTLPENTPIFNKLTFGLTDQADILAAVAQTGRKTAILVGLETDVCVMHSALGLLEHGYRVAVVTDAVGTPAPNGAIGIGRIQQAGGLIVNTKGVFYEWLRDVETVSRFHQELPHMRAQVGMQL